MNKQDMLKIQTCVLRVNIHCDCEGCMHKVKKKLQKVKGVYKVSIDAAQGKVTVSGNADPASLIEKLEKAGKHAELWGGPQKGGPIFISNDQLKKFQIESIINKNGKQQQQQHKKNNGVVEVPNQKKGVVSKDEKFPGKDHKSVRFNLPEDEDEDEDEDDDYYDDEFDEDGDEFDDEFDDEDFDAHHKPPPNAALAKPNKAAAVAHHPKGGKDGKAKKGGGGGGGGIDMFLKGMLRKAGGKKGKSDKSSKKGENKKDDGGKNGSKKGGFELGDVKKGKNEDGWSKKGGENFDGGKHQQQGFNEMKVNHKGGGGGGGGGGGRNVDMMGQMGGFPAVAGMPAMNGGRFVGGGPGINPYSQQQHMAQMMLMNQQRENGHGAYHPLAYGRPPPPAMSYGPPAPVMGYGPPPPGTDQYTHMFSDENTGSCSIM